MSSGPENLRLVLGLKLRGARDARGWTLQQLAARAGVAVSYLSEIEKGKKYPKPEKLLALAAALETPFEELVSPRVAAELSPLSAFAGSELLREFPFELFGLEAADLFELVAGDPKRAGALLRSFGEIARRYDLEVEQLLFAALRAFQEVEGNFFPEIEAAAERFRAESGWQGRDRLEERDVRRALESRFGYRVDLERLPAEHELADLRSVFAEGPPPTLYVNGGLLPQQRAFVAAREIGYRVLGLEQRAVTGSWLKAESFEQVLANFEASYFAGALLIPRAALAAELGRFFAAKKFRPQALSGMLRRFRATPEMLFYRVSQVAPSEFGLTDLFFVRFFREPDWARPRLTKVLNLARVDVPYGVGPEEHYCRRWPGVAILGGRKVRARTGELEPAAALCRFQSEPVEFLVVSLARHLALRPKTLSSVSIGFVVDERLRAVARFLDDPALPRRAVDLTCERCPLDAAACKERAAPPSVLERRRRLARRERAIAALLGPAAR
ncbi:MAG TPA: helix-turn-helix domain-containing protein [Thermoanaerobaculia bacterium]|nr:helix-turn-helix domain-containing protein [Thermoanaerobaculia bacterium]